MRILFLLLLASGAAAQDVDTIPLMWVRRSVMLTCGLSMSTISSTVNLESTKLYNDPIRLVPISLGLSLTVWGLLPSGNVRATYADGRIIRWYTNKHRREKWRHR
jgi:hypothetical protein